MRVERALPLNLQTQATLSFDGPAALLRVQAANSATLLRCARGADLAEALAQNAEGRAARDCETQLLDDTGDLIVYEASRRVPALCPGGAATLSEEQLERALFLPALSLEQTPEGIPRALILQDGTLQLCGDGEDKLARSSGRRARCSTAGWCLQLRRGRLLPGREEVKPDDVAASLYFAQAIARPAAAPIAPASCEAAPGAGERAVDDWRGRSPRPPPRSFSSSRKRRRATRC